MTAEEKYFVAINVINKEIKRKFSGMLVKKDSIGRDYIRNLKGFTLKKQVEDYPSLST